jgi:hypothetical protein
VPTAAARQFIARPRTPVGTRLLNPLLTLEIPGSGVFCRTSCCQHRGKLAGGRGYGQ